MAGSPMDPRWQQVGGVSNSGALKGIETAGGFFDKTMQGIQGIVDRKTENETAMQAMALRSAEDTDQLEEMYKATAGNNWVDQSQLNELYTGQKEKFTAADLAAEQTEYDRKNYSTEWEEQIRAAGVAEGFTGRELADRELSTKQTGAYQQGSLAVQSNANKNLHDRYLTSRQDAKDELAHQRGRPGYVKDELIAKAGLDRYGVDQVAKTVDPVYVNWVANNDGGLRKGLPVRPEQMDDYIQKIEGSQRQVVQTSVSAKRTAEFLNREQTKAQSEFYDEYFTALGEARAQEIRAANPLISNKAVEEAVAKDVAVMRSNPTLKVLATEKAAASATEYFDNIKSYHAAEQAKRGLDPSVSFQDAYQALNKNLESAGFMARGGGFGNSSRRSVDAFAQASKGFVENGLLDANQLKTAFESKVLDSEVYFNSDLRYIASNMFEAMSTNTNNPRLLQSIEEVREKISKYPRVTPEYLKEALASLQEVKQREEAGLQKANDTLRKLGQPAPNPMQGAGFEDYKNYFTK